MPITLGIGSSVESLNRGNMTPWVCKLLQQISKSLAALNKSENLKMFVQKNPLLKNKAKI